MSLYPVFIVGSPRSGTSILVGSLLRAGYFGFNEGNFLPVIREIQRVVDRHFQIFGRANNKVLASCVDQAALKTRLEDVVLAAAADLNTKTPWVDKTGNPEMIELIPVLLRTWPQARFIFAKRRALENITSRLLKFPNLNFEYHCQDWARNMAAWRRIKEQLPGLAAIEVDQRDISIAPAMVAEHIARLLQMTPQQGAVLLQTFTGERPQQTAPGTADRVLSLDELPWDAAQREVFHRVCDPEMHAEGYTTDATYRVSR